MTLYLRYAQFDWFAICCTRSDLIDFHINQLTYNLTTALFNNEPGDQMVGKGSSIEVHTSLEAM